MKISIGCDHSALDLKNVLIKHLEQKGHEIIDRGTYTYDSCDYTDYDSQNPRSKIQMASPPYQTEKRTAIKTRNPGFLFFIYILNMCAFLFWVFLLLRILSFNSIILSVKLSQRVLF